MWVTARRGQTEAVETIKIGPPLLFERLWQELGMAEVLSALLNDRRFQFSVERAIFLTVLHRLFDPGSDRAAEVWRKGPGTRASRSAVGNDKPQQPNRRAAGVSPISEAPTSMAGSRLIHRRAPWTDLGGQRMSRAPSD